MFLVRAIFDALIYCWKTSLFAEIVFLYAAGSKRRGNEIPQLAEFDVTSVSIELRVFRYVSL